MHSQFGPDGNIWWIMLIFGRDIGTFQRMTPTDLGSLLTFQPAPLSG